MMHMKKWIVAGERAGLLRAVSFALLVFAGSAPGTAAPARDQPFRLLGSSTVADLGDMLAAGFAKRDGSKPVYCPPCDSRHAMTCLANRECDLVLVVRSLAGGANVRKRFEEIPLARYAIAVVVNAKGPVRSMTKSELAGVFEGKITSWSGVEQSRAGQRIELFSPLVSKTESYVFRRRVMLDAPFAQQLRDSTGDPGRQKRFADEVVGAVIGNGGGIGFLQLAPDATVDKRVRLLGISPRKGDKPVVPTAETIADGSYPITDRLTLYLHPDAPQAAREFCAYATGPEAAEMVRQFHLWPEYELEQVRGKQRLADAKAGKGTVITVCDMAGCGDLLKDLSLEFVKAKAAVQLKLQKGTTQEEAVEKLANGAIELLLTDGSLPEEANPKAEGENKEAALTPALSQGEREKPAAQSPIPDPQSPRRIELGRMAVGVIVHPDNPLESLPLDEAKAIFTGEIKKWPAVRGAAPAMHIFGLKHSDPISQLLKEKLIEGGSSRIPRLSSLGALKHSPQPDSEKVILAVARDPAAIGFVDMSQLSPNEKSVKLVPVYERKPQGDSPSFVGRKSGQSQPNPLSRTLTLYVSPKASETAKDFAEFLTPEHCKKVIAQYNLLPPLHTEDARQFAEERHPKPKREETKLASADEPPPLLLDDPDAPQDQPRVKIRKAVARAEPPASEQPEPSKLAAAPPPASARASDSASQPTQGPSGEPSLSDQEIIWIICGVAGVVILAIGIGWLQAPKRKKPRRYMPK